MPKPPRTEEIDPQRLLLMRTHAEELLDWIPLVTPLPGEKIKVILFKDSGKYYTEEEWEVPVMGNALGPHVMIESTDFRRIGDGKVLVPSRYWGFPALL